MRALGLDVDRALPNSGNLPHCLLNWLGLREALIRTRIRRQKSGPLIFTISPGRSGTGFMAALMGSAANAVAFHEPRPRMTGRFLQAVNEGYRLRSFRRRRIKLVPILATRDSLPDTFCYIETSHMFIKTFYDVVLDHFDDVKVVHLRRDIPYVIRSFAALGYFHDSSSHWRHWMHDPYASEPLVPPVVPIERADSFDRTIAYLADIEARTVAFRERYPETPVVSVQIDSVSDPGVAKELFVDLGLEWTVASERACSTRRNRRQQAKRGVNRTVGLDYCRERLARYVEMAAEQSIRLPDSFAASEV